MGEWSNLTQREKADIIRFAIKNGVSDINTIRDTFNIYTSDTENELKEGGSIHIKHPGRLTALKKRTGKTEAELWATGNDATRKMITFARNARKWKHDDGGSLDTANIFDKGGEIYIKPSKRGTFTAVATKHGKSVQEFARQVLANKENYSPAIVKKANFARNASKWHKGEDGLDLNSNLPEITVTPRGNYITYTGYETNKPSLEDYITSRQERARIDAVNNILNLKAPIVPIVPNQSIKSRIAGLLGMSPEERIRTYGAEQNPLTCITTATGVFPKGSTASSVELFSNNPENYGFVLDETLQPRMGDLMVFRKFLSRGANHGTVVTGFNIDRKPVLTYSRGGSNEEDIIRDNDNWSYPDSNNYLGNLGIGLPYRFIGTPQQQQTWIQEYNDLYDKKSTGGPLYPFSFQKNPYWKTPVVRYNRGGHLLQDGGYGVFNEDTYYETLTPETISWIKEISGQQKYARKHPETNQRGVNAEFWGRLLEPTIQTIKDWEHEGGVASHKLSYAEADGKYYVYPEVQFVENKLIDYTDPRNRKVDSFRQALDNNNYIIAPNEKIAANFTKAYKQYPAFTGMSQFRDLQNIGDDIVYNSNPKKIDAMYNAVIKAGYSPVQASGIIGSALVESRMNEYQQEVGNSGKGYGLMQWTDKTRRANLDAYKPKGVKTEFERQVGFMLQELKDPNMWVGGKKSIEAFMNAKTIEDAVKIFAEKYEHPKDAHMDRRIAVGELVHGRKTKKK